MRIAQAASSETYSKYGKAPNQRRTGVTSSRPEGNLDGELNIVEFSGGWEKVYRPIDGIVAEKIAKFMYNAVANGSYIGYSQDTTRTGVFDTLAEIGSADPWDISTPVNCDCATLVGAAVWYAGIEAAGLRKLCTWEMNTVLINTGAFTVLASKELCQDGKGIRRGDILWRDGHTAVALDTDRREPRVSLTDDGLMFTDGTGQHTGSYPADATKLLKDNGLRVVNAAGNSWYLYSTKGSATYSLVSDVTYLVTCVQRNSNTAANGAAWIVSAHKDKSNLFALKASTTTKAEVNGLTLTITRGSQYARVTITRLS